MTYALHHGDCLEVMAGLPDASVDLTVTSPPYDNLRTYNGFTFDFEGIAREEVRRLQASRLSHTSASFWSGGSRDNGREIQAAKEAEWRAYGC